MEILAAAAVIVVILLILGFSVGAIITGFLYVLSGLLLLSELFFAVCFVRLIAAKRVDAEFTRIDKRAGARYESAFYKTAEGEFSNIFPCEVVMRDKFYKKDKKIKVRLDRFTGAGRRVMDINASVTICLGLVLCAPVPATAIYLIFFR